MSDFVEVPLHRIAYARSGDKGNRLNIALIAAAPHYYQTIAEQVTESLVAAVFASRRPTRVVRYELPKLFAFNFVLDDVLEGGVNSSLGLDGHGKSLSYLFLAAPIRVSRDLLEGGGNSMGSNAEVLGSEPPSQR